MVSNHPHGLVDGIILAELVGRVRTDYKVLTRSLLTGVPQIEQFMLAVAFPHEANAQQLNIEMRQKCMEHLNQGGAVVLFPAGSVGNVRDFFRRCRRTRMEPLYRENDSSILRDCAADQVSRPEFAPLPDCQSFVGHHSAGAFAARSDGRAEQTAVASGRQADHI